MRLTGLWWWIDRWRKSTAYTDMTLEQQGAYRNLLDEAQLRGGAIPNEDRILAKACGDALAWKKLRTVVLARFYLTDDGWRNETLDEVIRESQRRAEKQQRYRHKHGHGGGNGGGNDPGNGGGNASGSPDPDPDLDPEQEPDPSTHTRPQPSARLAFAGKVLEVPKFLDDEFVKRLNGQYFDLTTFYVALDQRLAQTGEPYDLRWIRDQFAKESPQPERRKLEREPPPFTSVERQKAERYRRSVWGGCRHEPRCETAGGCIAKLILDWRATEIPA